MPDNGFLPGHRGFHRVAGAPGAHVRGQAQVGHLFDGLVSRAVFTQADGIVGIDQNVGLMHQGRHAHRVAGIFHEHQEGAAVGAQAAVQAETILDRGHGEFTHAVMDVVAAGIIRGDRLAALPDGVVGAGQIGGATGQFRQQRTEGIEGVLAGLAGGHLVAFFLTFPDIGICLLQEVGGQLTSLATQELCRQLRIGGFVGVETLLPVTLGSGPFFATIPGLLDLGGNLEGTVLPAQRFPGQGNFIFAQGGTVGFFLALLVGAAETDNGLAANQGGLIGIGTGIFDSHLHFFRAVAIHIGNHLPAVGTETLHRVIGKPAFHLTINGNAVIVIKGHQLAQAQGTGQGTGFVGDAFHHAAITQETVGVMVDNSVPFTVELARQHLLRQCHAHRIGNTLTQRAGGGFDARGVAVFRVAGGGATQLTEVLDVVQADAVAAQVQQTVKQHGAVTIGQHEAIPVGPGGILRVVLEEAAPQHLGDIGHSHGRTGVPGIGFLYRIHAQGTDSVGEFTAGGGTGHAGLQTGWWLKRGAIVPQGDNRYKRGRPARRFTCPRAALAGDRPGRQKIYINLF